MIKKAFVVVLLLAFAAQAACYELPGRNLVIVEVDSIGPKIEKKVAGNADLLFSREMKTVALLGTGGIEGYRATFTLNLKNVSGQRLESVSLIESIPKSVADNSVLVESDSQFTVLEQDPVIKFDAGPIGGQGVKRLAYRISFKEEKLELMEGLFKEMEVPAALIPISEDDCTGIICNDFNPCTEDYCGGGSCVYSNVTDGVPCEEGMACVAGTCEKFQNPDMLLAAAILTIAVVLVSVVLIYKSKRSS